MIKRGKILIICFIVLLVSGCRAEYNININNDLTINEEVKLLEDNQTISSFGPNIDDYVSNMMLQFKDTNINDNHYISKQLGKKKSGAIATKIYDNFESFTNASSLKGRIFDTMTIERSSDLVSIHFTPTNKNFDVFESTPTRGRLLEDITLTIKLPYKVIDNNADEIDLLNNTYTWNYNKTTIYKTVSLTFDENKTYKVSFIDKIVVYYKQGKLTIPMTLVSLALFTIAIISFIAKRNVKINRI